MTSCVHNFYWVKLTLHTCVYMNTNMKCTYITAHIPAPKERQKGPAGLTDQFPIFPSRPVVIRSSCTWREAWIPLGFISSNYPLFPPAVHSLFILYFSSGFWHCPLLPPSSSTLFFFPLLPLSWGWKETHSEGHGEFQPSPTGNSSRWLIHGLVILPFLFLPTCTLTFSCWKSLWHADTDTRPHTFHTAHFAFALSVPSNKTATSVALQ